MKQLIVAMLAAVTIAGAVAQPASAENLQKKRRHLEHEIAHRNQVELNRVHKWERKHPHATAKQHRNISKWITKHSRKTEKLGEKKIRVEQRAARRARHRH